VVVLEETAAVTQLIQDQVVVVPVVIQATAVLVAQQEPGQSVQVMVEVVVVLLTLVKVMAVVVQEYSVKGLAAQPVHSMDLQAAVQVSVVMPEQDLLEVIMVVVAVLVMMILTDLVATAVKVLFVLCGVQVEHIH
jgi:hypothetical protein